MTVQLVQEGRNKETEEGLSGTDFNPTARNSGYFTLAGAIAMLVGAALWGTSGTDL